MHGRRGLELRRHHHLTVAACAALLVGRAAQATPLEARALWVAPDGAAGYASTVLGLVVAAPGRPARLVRSAALGTRAGLDTPALSAAGRLFVPHPEGLGLSDDGGCRFRAARGAVAGRWVEQVVVDPRRPERVLAATATDGRDNGVYESIDGGASFGRPLVASPRAYFKALAFAPSRPGRLYALGYQLAPRWTITLWVSDDGGARFDPRDVTLGAPAVPDLLVVDPRRPERLAWRLVRPDGALVVGSDDGGVTAKVRWSGDPVRGLAVAPSGALFVAAGAALLRSTDGGQRWSAAGPAPAGGCLAWGGGALWGCGDGDALILRAPEGAGPFAPVARAGALDLSGRCVEERGTTALSGRRAAVGLASALALAAALAAAATAARRRARRRAR